MPNYYAHMVYGEAVYHALPEALQARIEPGMEAYILGLFGPDPFLFLMSGLQQARRVHRGPGKIPAQLYRQAVALWCWTELGKKLRLAELYRTGYNIIKVSNGEMPSDR